VTVLTTCAGSPGSAQGNRPHLELADIVRKYRSAYEDTHALSSAECAALDAIEWCRTPALGGHVDVCLECGHSRPSYNSCHDRHCPKCPAVAQAKWIAGRLERVLPTHYFHVVFTLPAELRGIARGNRAVVYDLLFRCAAETLLELGRDPKRLGGEIGITTVLHTWARDLSYHPHVHCIVTGGGLSSDGERWESTRPDYLFPIEVMRKLFRGKMLDGVKRAQERGQLRVNDPVRLAATLAGLYRKDWVVYCKRPFGGPEQVIRYLGQYTHRVALSNHRLVAMDEDGVTFRTKNGKTVTLDGVTFLARWLSHVLPRGFVKIRHHGLMSAAHAKTRLELARERLEKPPVGPDLAHTPARLPAREDALHAAKWRDVIELLTGIDLGVCPACGSRALERRPLERVFLEPRGPPKAA
jgi:hypothetical protein